VDVLLLDGTPAAGEEEAAVTSFIKAVQPRIQIFCRPYTERSAVQTDPAAVSALADGYGLPITASTLVTFKGTTDDDAPLAQRSCDRFARVKCTRSVHPVTLLRAIPDGLVRGVEMDAATVPPPKQGTVTLEEFKKCGWVKTAMTLDEFTAPLQTPGNALQAQCFADHTGKGETAKLRAAMLLRLRVMPPCPSFGIASCRPGAPFHVDGTLPDVRDFKANPVVKVDADSARVLSFVEVMALQGYRPEMHNLSTEPLGNQKALVAKAVPAPIWVMALLAAVTELKHTT